LAFHRQTSQPTELCTPGESNKPSTTTFGLEKDMQTALRANITQLEGGLKMSDEGIERRVASGFIDITAEDTSGRTVVIELKTGEARREAVGQILAYMGDMTDTNVSVRGILVAGSFSTSAVSASRAIPNLQLQRYQYRFTFESVGTERLSSVPII